MSIYEYDEEKHMRQTREEGYEDGLAAGREDGVKALIETCQARFSREEVEKILREHFPLSPQEVQDYMQKYWISDNN